MTECTLEVDYTRLRSPTLDAPSPTAEEFPATEIELLRAAVRAVDIDEAIAIDGVGRAVHQERVADGLPAAEPPTNDDRVFVRLVGPERGPRRTPRLAVDGELDRAAGEAWKERLVRPRGTRLPG